jgi:dihydrofolate reductase
VSGRPLLILIAAVARNGVIGVDNRLPWRLPEDLRHFKATTLGHPVIMGRKTWESLGRPLPGRLNIVITRNPDYAAGGAVVVTSLPAALSAAAAALPPGGEAYLIGGAELYAQALSFADRLVLTEIDADFPGDAFFPAFDRRRWREVDRQPAVSADGLPYAFVTYQRA